ncbi:sigma-70 family RNA polymerase sigma factor [Chitinivibrio alkaliphilus]|uniref:RNA polymerase sigma factor rpoD n=1 Tax=Chitinivibrio alkaliphilus ACht1 TaxID=1313304 RepID=U7D6H5_9BACT|nr:RNA polymerase sigma factor RpoD/SigA [Chitinivibrio alkaliphilus]ERP32119.1 RNA polymerase sigma factor rpoD [Chitinivibrio alkaliphilus ACht1]
MAKKNDKSMFFVEEGSLGLYLKDIAKHESLTQKEEQECARRIRKGDKKAVETLVRANLRFVVSVARNYQNQGMPLADLINEGNLGLIRAAYRFDEKKNFKFISYAVWWIRQAILQGLADHSRIVKVPLNRVATIHKVGKARVRLEQKYRRLPNDKEIADELDIPEKEVTSTLKISNRHASLDSPIKDENGGSLFDIIGNEDVEDTDQRAMDTSITREVKKVLESLTEREQNVVCMYFGINEDTNYTLEEIGQQLQITRERVRQIKDAALRKLRRSGKAQKLIKNALFS